MIESRLQTRFLLSRKSEFLSSERVGIGMYQSAQVIVLKLDSPFLGYYEIHSMM